MKPITPAMNNAITKKIQCFLILFLTVIASLLSANDASAQTKPHYLRIANIVVDSSRLEAYKVALKEGVETAVRTEPGVLMLYAVYEKDHPTHVTVFEIYADEDAYKSHIQTAHFKKYKDTVAGMVKSLQLTDVDAIAMEAKQKL